MLLSLQFVIIQGSWEPQDHDEVPSLSEMHCQQDMESCLQPQQQIVIDSGLSWRQNGRGGAGICSSMSFQTSDVEGLGQVMPRVEFAFMMN